MSAIIYSNSCVTCGQNAIYVARVQKKYHDVEIVNTRIEHQRLIEQLTWQEEAGLGKSPLPIVVENNGEAIFLLKEWRK